MSDICTKPVVLIALYNYDSLAVRMLYSYLENKGVKVYFLAFKCLKKKNSPTLKNDYSEPFVYHDEITEQDISALIAKLKEIDPFLIGISLLSSHFEDAKLITNRIKLVLNVPVVWGGSHPTIDPEGCIKESDMVCVGEGFEPLFEICSALKEGRSCESIKNIWINKDGNIKRNEQRPLMNDLDVLSPPSCSPENKIYIDEGRVLEGMNTDWFGMGFTDEPLKSAHHTMAAFGCPCRCSYCIHSLPGNAYRLRSPQSVIRELLHAKKNNNSMRIVFFWDNIFGVNKKWSLEFCRLYEKEIALPFFAYAHPLFIDKEVITAMRRAGWAIADMGIQSGCEKIRKDMYGRRETNEQIVEAARQLDALRKVKSRKNYFKIYYDYIKGNPCEGEKELSEGLDMFLKFPKGFIFQAFNLCVFPNYPITKYMLDKALITEKDIEKDVNGMSAVNWVNTFNSKKEYDGYLKRHEYYYLLLSLTQYKSFPNSLIKFIEKRKLFADNLKALYRICRVVRFFELTFRLSNYRWLWETIALAPLDVSLKRAVVNWKRRRSYK
ncbi:MAG: cobalamin-dependent protein [Candidatus Omnitrophota bacterium]